MEDNAQTRKQHIDELVTRHANIAKLEQQRNTERTCAEGSQKEQEWFAGELIDNSAVATFVLNRQHTVVLWNKACEELTGIPASHMKGTDHQWKPFYTQKRPVLADIIIDGSFDDMPSLYGKFTRSTLLINGLHSEGWRQNLNGRDRYIIFDASPIFNTKGEMVAVIETLQDISERKSAEETLLLRGQQLHKLVQSIRAITEVLEIPIVLRQLVGAAIELTEAQAGAAGVILNNQMVFTEYNQKGQLIPIDYRFAAGYGVPGWVMQTRGAYLSADAESDPHVIPEIQKALGFRTLANVPIFNRHVELIGCIEVHNKRGGHPFNELDVELLSGLADSASVALENARMLDERKKAEEALRASEERFRFALKAANQGLYDLNVQTGETQVSPEYATMLGYDPTVFHETNEAWIERLHPEDREGVVSMFRNYIAGKVPDYRVEFRHRTKSGKWKWILSLGRVVEWDARGEPLRMMGTHTDITNLKYAEESIARERILSDHIINSLPGIFYMYDDNGKLVRWNKKHEEVTGYSPQELFGMHPADFFTEAHKQYMVSRVQSVFTEGEAFAEAPLLTKSGEHIPYLFTGRLTVLDGRQYLLGVGVDITDRKRVAEEKDSLQSQLLQAQKMESVARLAGGVAHDFNNMLGVILGHVELAMMQGDPRDQVNAHLEEIHKAAKRSADLTRQLLAFARRQTVTPKVLDLNDCVTGMLKMIQRLIGEDIDLVWMPGTDIWRVKIDPAQIDQILANLCVNARDAIAGVGKVTIETQNITFDEAYCAVHKGFGCGAYVMLAVSDDGSGMSKNVIDHLFEPFFTTKEVGKGTGLGLATVYGIVKQNEGFINVYSEPTEGTTFKAYLPRFFGEAREQKSESALETPKGSGEKVLLVEDEAAILHIGKAMLEKLGYKVLTASTPGEALRQFKAHVAEIQLLITDVVMPEMNGRDLAKLIIEIKPELKCLFISGYTADVIAHHGMLAGNLHSLQKPFSMNDLASKVREALDRE
jgi:PAS domain S-box-containing protein